MGTTYIHSDKTPRQFILQYLKDCGYKVLTLKKSVEWYAVVEHKGKRVVLCILHTKKQRVQGIKLVNAEAFPYYFNCPMSIVEGYGSGDERINKWFNECRKYQSKRQQAIDIYDKLEICDSFINGQVFFVYARWDGVVYVRHSDQHTIYKLTKTRFVNMYCQGHIAGVTFN